MSNLLLEQGPPSCLLGHLLHAVLHLLVSPDKLGDVGLVGTLLDLKVGLVRLQLFYSSLVELLEAPQVGIGYFLVLSFDLLVVNLVLQVQLFVLDLEILDIPLQLFYSVTLLFQFV